MKKLTAVVLVLGSLALASPVMAGSDWGDPTFDRIYGE
jgi:hypothetical protein